MLFYSTHVEFRYSLQGQRIVCLDWSLRVTSSGAASHPKSHWRPARGARQINFSRQQPSVPYELGIRLSSSIRNCSSKDSSRHRSLFEWSSKSRQPKPHDSNAPASIGNYLRLRSFTWWFEPCPFKERKGKIRTNRRCLESSHDASKPLVLSP